MIGSDIKEINTEIRAGREMDDVIFYVLLNQERRRIEQKRPWRMLATTDTTQSTSPSDTYLTQHTLPARFIRFSSFKRKIQLVNGTDVVTLEEIPFEAMKDYQSSQGYFAIDYKNNKYYVMGTYGKSYTHNINFCQSQATIGANDDWALGGEDFAAILAFAVAVIDESGIDYDEVNMKQATGNSITASTIERTMNKWDDQLTRSALNA